MDPAQRSDCHGKAGNLADNSLFLLLFTKTVYVLDPMEVVLDGGLVGASGIEPPTTTMSRWCSTTELRAYGGPATIPKRRLADKISRASRAPLIVECCGRPEFELELTQCLDAIPQQRGLLELEVTRVPIHLSL
jgi:hypothetical protein